MIATRNEHTLASTCEVTGRGYWSGREVRVVCQPAGAGEGIVLVRSDLASHPRCPASIQHAGGISFRTNLCCGDASFAMIEHLMAALAGLEIDNCLVEVSGEELPGLDGSSLAYVDALQAAGLVIQPAARRTLILQTAIRVELDDAWITAHPCQSNLTTYEYQLDYGAEGPLQRQTVRMPMSPRTFTRQIAPARTFVTLAQADALRAQGLAGHVTNQELLVLGADGPIDNPLRFRDECARHKLLDMIGDLALAGVDIVGEIVSHRGGHRLNAMMAQRLSQAAAAQTSVPSISRLAMPITSEVNLRSRPRRHAG